MAQARLTSERGERSLPNLSHDAKNTFLSETSLDLDKSYSSPEEIQDNRCEKGKLTSIRKLQFKSIVLITDDAKNISLFGPENSNVMIILPHILRKNSEHSSLSRSSFFERLKRQSVYVTFTGRSLENEQYIKCLRDILLESRASCSKNYGRVNTFKALLLDGLKMVPSELKEYFSTVIHSDANVKKVVCFIEETNSQNLMKLQNMIEKLYTSPCQKINIKVDIHENGMDGTAERAYKFILDMFEDLTSHPRQQLQFKKISNIQLVKSESNSSAREMCIEVRPRNMEEYLQLLESIHSGEFDYFININANIRTRVQPESVVDVLNYFAPDITQNKGYLLKRLAQEMKIDQLIQLLKTDYQHHGEQADGVNAEKLHVICSTLLYLNFLNRADKSPFEYLRFFKKAGCPDYLIQIRTSDGYNALHLAVKYEREDFMKMLFYANKWFPLRHGIVKPLTVHNESKHAGYTPRRLAEALSYKSSGLKVLKKFDEYDRYMRHMLPIHKCCLMGSVDLTSAMIDLKRDLIDVKDENHASCLIYACSSGRAKLVKYLLQSGADLNVRTRDGESPAHIAVMFGHLDVLDLLSHYFFDICGQLNGYGYDALSYCAKFGSIDGLRFFKERGFKICARILAVAAKHQQQKAMDFILDEVTDVNAGSDNEGKLAIHHCIINCNVSGIKKLIAKGAKLTLVDNFNKNVFHMATGNRHRDVLNVLVVEAKRTGCLNSLINAKDIFTGEDLFAIVRGKDRGCRAWHWLRLNRFAVRGFTNAMKTGQIDVRNYGEIICSSFGAGPDKSCRKEMEERKRDILKERKPDLTPLHLAAINDAVGVVEVLLSNGARPDEVDYSGATAMHYAAMNDNVAIMELLLKAGGSDDIQTLDGQTPHQIALFNLSTSASTFLENAMPMKKARVFVNHILNRMPDELGKNKLKAQREAGKDVKKYVVEILRNLNVEINELLLELDSGPVQEATK